MHINQAGLDLIKHFEGLRLSTYRDAVGKLTIGYGHTGKDVTPNKTITEPEADEILETDIEYFEEGVQKLVKVPVNENQFSALVCFAFNLGLGNLQQSTLLRCLNAKNYEDAANEFLRWTKAGGNELPGLVRRRKAERELFLK